MSEASEILEKLSKALSTEDAGDNDDILDIDKVPTAASDVEKAMTTRSIPHLSTHAQRGAYSNATDPITRRNTKLSPPEGRAPLMAETITHNVGDEYASCGVHGTTFKSIGSCPHCFLSKGYSCKACGGDMMKNAGGTSCCQKCGA